MKNGALRTTLGLAALLAMLLLSTLASASAPGATLPVAIDAAVEPVRITNETTSLRFEAIAEQPLIINYQLGAFVLGTWAMPANGELESSLFIEERAVHNAPTIVRSMSAPPPGAAISAQHRDALYWKESVAPTPNLYERSVPNRSVHVESMAGPAWGAVAIARLEPGRAEILKVELAAPILPGDPQVRAERIHYFVKVWSTDPADAVVVPVGQRYDPHNAAASEAPFQVAQDNLTMLCAGIVVASGGAAGWKWLRSRDWALPLPWPLLFLFTRLQRSRLLDQPTRRQVHDMIEANPGIRFADLRRQTRLAAGVVTHHLRMLEDHGLVRSVIRGRQRHLYAKGTPVDDASSGLTEQQRAILGMLREGQLSQREIARRLGVSQQTVSYHARRLHAFGLGATPPTRVTPSAPAPNNPWAPRLQLGA